MVTVGARPQSLWLESYFVFQEQHFVTFKVTAHVDLSSVVAHTCPVEWRNNKQQLMATRAVGDLVAGRSYSKQTSRLLPSNMRLFLTTCTASVELDDGRSSARFNPGLATVSDLPLPPPTYRSPAYGPLRFRDSTEHHAWNLRQACTGPSTGTT